MYLGIKDILITPVYLIVAFFLTLHFKKFVPSKNLETVLVKGLFIKIFSAIALGLIYQFYYHGGDTINYFRDSSIVAESLLVSPKVWANLVFGKISLTPLLFDYSGKLIFFYDPQSYFVVRFTSILNLLTFNTYTATALLYATISFNGIWHLFLVLRKLYPKEEKLMSYACFYLPSLAFWGSGILKDSILICGIGWAFYSVYHILFLKQINTKNIILLILATIVITNVKPFVFVAFFPPFLIWFGISKIRKIKNTFNKTFFAPAIFLTTTISTYILLSYATKDTFFNINKLDEISQNIKISKDYLFYIATIQNGSAYDIGELDGSILNMVMLAPNAIWVTFFRPYIWESFKNLNMFIASIESSFFLIFFVYVFVKTGILKSLKIIWNDEYLLFALSYALFFGAVVGLSSANFGTLVRYKIPTLPFFLSSLFVIYSHKRNTKVSVNGKSDTTTLLADSHERVDIH